MEALRHGVFGMLKLGGSLSRTGGGGGGGGRGVDGDIDPLGREWTAGNFRTHMRRILLKQHQPQRPRGKPSSLPTGVTAERQRHVVGVMRSIMDELGRDLERGLRNIGFGITGGAHVLAGLQLLYEQGSQVDEYDDGTYDDDNSRSIASSLASALGGHLRLADRLYAYFLHRYGLDEVVERRLRVFLSVLRELRDEGEDARGNGDGGGGGNGDGGRVGGAVGGRAQSGAVTEVCAFIGFLTETQGRSTPGDLWQVRSMLTDCI